MTTPDDGFTAIRRRYRDAYSVAASMVSLGGLLKVLGIVAAALILLIGSGATNQGGAAAISDNTIVFAVAVAIGGMLYVFGVVVTTLGQILRATLDTAVNTSPVLSIEQQRDIILPHDGPYPPSN